jgi:hypothetical protein
VDREEQCAVKFTLDKESPIQGQEPQASGDVSREGRIFLIVTNTGVESVIGGKSRLSFGLKMVSVITSFTLSSEL